MKKIILDTDMGNDCDDAGALALLHNLEKLGECEIVAVTSSTSRRDGAGCIDAINKYYNRDIPVGMYLGDNFLEDGYGEYSRCVARNYKNDFLDKDAKDATILLVEQLVKAKENSITLVVIGPLNNIWNLLNYSEDVNGFDLLKSKVKEVIIMGGYFKEFSEEVYFAGEIMEAEWNILQDINSAREFVDKCPVEIIFCPFDLGMIKTGSKLFKKGYNSPIRLSYEVHSAGLRESWDPITCYFAVRGECNLWSLSNFGSVLVNEEGVTIFKENKNGKHRVLLFKESENVVQEEIDKWIY